MALFLQGKVDEWEEFPVPMKGKGPLACSLRVAEIGRSMEQLNKLEPLVWTVLRV